MKATGTAGLSQHPKRVADTMKALRTDVGELKNDMER